MKHCILARFRADAGDWRAYLPEIREIFSAAGDIPGVRGAEVFHNCVDRENRYHVLIRLDMDPAALAAYDVSPKHHRWKDRFPKVGLFELGEFIDFLKSNLKSKKLEELQIPLIITATDLDHGRLVHFHKGDIAERVAASCCMPVLFAPVNIDGTHYVDGGLLMNLPVSTLRRICEKVIAVNVSPLMATKYKMNIVSIALRSYNFMFRSNSFPEREKADLLIEPYNLEGYSNTELEKAEEIFMQGYNTTNDILERLLIDKGSIWKE